jgi:hypothetical protein
VATSIGSHAGLIVDGLGVVSAMLGTGIAPQMALGQAQVAELTSA